MGCVFEALDAKGYTHTGTTYIGEINGLSEFDGGGQSGWMGTLNDWFANEGFAAFTVAAGKLEAGDEIRVMYSCAYGNDLGGSWGNNDTTVKALTFSTGELSPAFHKDTHSYTLKLAADVSSVVVTPTASNKNFQVRTSVDGTEYKRTAKIPVADGTVITVKCGDPSWPSMNKGAEAHEYKITVSQEGPCRREGDAPLPDGGRLSPCSPGGGGSGQYRREVRLYRCAGGRDRPGRPGQGPRVGLW